MKLRPPPKFATLVEDRKPVIKYHQTLGQAKSAVQYVLSGGARGGKVYKWSETYDEWQLMYDVEPQTDRSDLPWRTEDNE